MEKDHEEILRLIQLAEETGRIFKDLHIKADEEAASILAEAQLFWEKREHEMEKNK
ncbi:MAG: hypothetical protein HY979_03530 [Candidatus Magasanikbacteria bacterium]|nr:hypothetical protein [Candidatus Magasanikbacteria bacterium]